MALAAVSCLLVGLSVTACGEDSSGSGSSGGSASSSTPGKGKTIGIVYFLNADTPSAVVGKSYVDAAKKLGYKVTGIDAQGSPATAVQAIQTLVQRRVDVIAVQLWQTNQVQAGIRAAQAAKIPLLGISSNDLGGEDGYRFVTQFGPKSGEALGDLIASKVKDGGASMLAIGYTPGTIAKTREDGLKAALSSVPDVKLKRNELNVTDINASVANSVNAWLGDNPKGSAKNMIVWVPSSCCVVPAANTIRQAKRTDVKVYGFVDGTPATLGPLKQGGTEALGADDLAGQGQKAAEATLGVIDGGIDGPQKMIALPPEIVTADNLDAYLKKNPGLEP